MDWLSVFLKASRVFLQGVAHLHGIASIPLLWLSFYDGRAGMFAAFALVMAAGITLGLPPPPPRPSRKPR
jgi:hypothetical protein